MAASNVCCSTLNSLHESRSIAALVVSRSIWAFGPRRVGSNILFNMVPDFAGTPFWKSICSSEEPTRILALTLIDDDETTAAAPTEPSATTADATVPSAPETNTSSEDADAQQASDDASTSPSTLTPEEANRIWYLQDIESSILSGFQLATGSGPLCEEPMRGVAMFVESITITPPKEDDKKFGPFRGQVIATTKEVCRGAFMRRSVRIVEPLYICDIQVPSTYLIETRMIVCLYNYSLASFERQPIKWVMRMPCCSSVAPRLYARR